MPVKKNLIGLLFVYVLLGVVFTCSWFEIPDWYVSNYAVLLLAYFMIGGINFYFWCSGKVRFFDTFSIISFLYMMIMIVYPLHDYMQMNLTKGGVDTSEGCIKATILFITSYILFCLGYFTTKNSRKHFPFFDKIERQSDRKKKNVALFCWCIAFIGCMMGQISRGFSLSYLLSIGSMAQDDVFINSSSGGLLFLLMFIPTMIVSAVMILAYSKSIFLKVCVLGLSVLFLFMRGSRIVMFVMVAAPIIYWYFKNNRSPSVKTLCIAFVAALTLFATLQIARGNIARGQDFKQDIVEKVISVDTFMSVFESDFSTYKVFYGIVEAIPDRMDYLYGRGIFGYTVALIVPRVLWPEKPDAPEREVVYAAMGQTAVDSGYAYPNIGIFYSEFGVPGCLFFMYLFGYLASKTRRLYMCGSKVAMILYACLWPFFFQFTARSISNAIYSLFFGFLPVLILRIVSRKEK